MKQIKVNLSTALMQKCKASRLIERIVFENLLRNGVKLNNQRTQCHGYLLKNVRSPMKRNTGRTLVQIRRLIVSVS